MRITNIVPYKCLGTSVILLPSSDWGCTNTYMGLCTNRDIMHRELIEKEVRDIRFREIGKDEVTPSTRPPCDAIADSFAHLLETEWNVTAHSPIKAPVDGRKHFVAIVELSDDLLVVDASLQQFGQDFPDVLIAPLGSDKCDQTYDNFNFNYCTHEDCSLN